MPTTFQQYVRKISVILPCFNEQKNIERFESELFPEIARLGVEAEYLIIDDGSSDGSSGTADRLCQRNPCVRLIRHLNNRGLGAAVRTGLAASEGDVVLTVDSDLSFPPSEIAKLASALDPGVDAVFGSPSMGHFDQVPLHRKILSQGLNSLYRIIAAENLTAFSSIFRLYRAESVKALHLESNSFDINAEIALKMVARGAHIIEVPVTLSTRLYGESSLDTAREIKNHVRLLANALKWRRAA